MAGRAGEKDDLLGEVQSHFLHKSNLQSCPDLSIITEHLRTWQADIQNKVPFEMKVRPGMEGACSPEMFKLASRRAPRHLLMSSSDAVENLS